MMGKPTGCYTNHYVRQAGYWVHMDGTSASAPLFAGLVAILNEARLAVRARDFSFAAMHSNTSSWQQRIIDLRSYQVLAFERICTFQQHVAHH